MPKSSYPPEFEGRFIVYEKCGNIEIDSDCFPNRGNSIVDVTRDQYRSEVSALVSAKVTSLFKHAVGVGTLTANLGATAAEQTPNTEISLVLDMSGSPRESDRIELMKSGLARRQFSVSD